MVDIQHERVGAFDEDLRVLLLCGGEEGNLVDNIVLELDAEVLNILISTYVKVTGKWSLIYTP